MTLEITDQNFETLLLNNSKPIVIDFWKPKCPPCENISSYIDSLAVEYEGQVIIAKADVEKNTELTSKYGIRCIPTIIFLKDGKVVDKHVGSIFKAELEIKLKAVL